MRKLRQLIAALLILLLSFGSAGCVHADAPATIVPDDGFAAITVWKVDGTTEHYYKINGKLQNVGSYDDITEKFLDSYTLNGRHIEKVYETDEITGDMLEHRNGALICELCVGIVTDAQSGDGRVINTKENYFNYISYRGFDQPYYDGTVVVTYLVYNPENNYVDDVIDRYDFVLTREYED